MQTDPIDALLAGVKQYLSELSDEDFAALVDEVRQPADGAKSKQQKAPAAKPGDLTRGRDRYQAGR